MAVATASQLPVRLGSTAEFVGPGPFGKSAAGVDIVLVRVGGQWRAYEGRCPHQGALLAEGEFDGDSLVCRNHGCRFSALDGRRRGGPECLAPLRVEERHGDLFVDISSIAPARRGAPIRKRIDDLPGPPAWPIVGNLLQLDPLSFHLDLERWAERYGPLYQLQVGGARTVVVSDPGFIDQVLRSRPNIFRRESNQDRILAELGVSGVFNAEGDVWRPQRRLAVAALAQRHIRELYPHIKCVAERLHRRWRTFAASGEPVDMVGDLQRYTVDITMLIAFGHDANTVENGAEGIQRQLEVVFPAITRRLFAPFPTWRYFRSPADRRLDQALAQVRDWLRGLMDQARGFARAPANFLEAMVAAVDDRGEPFPEQVVISNLLTMLIAGEDTTAFTLAWAIHHLCDDPSSVLALQEEADAAFIQADGTTSPGSAAALTFASAVANETMRLRPVGPIIASEALVDTEIDGLVIPRGAVVAALVRPAVLDEARFPAAREFRPQRWLSAQAGTQAAGVHIPFGAGPRSCPGRALAQTEMNALLSMLYGSFEVERVSPVESVKERFGFTMRPEELKVRLRLRQPRVQD